MTNVETMLLEDRTEVFFIHKRVIVELTREWAEWRNCVCGTEVVKEVKGCVGMQLLTSREPVSEERLVLSIKLFCFMLI